MPNKELYHGVKVMFLLCNNCWSSPIVFHYSSHLRQNHTRVYWIRHCNSHLQLANCHYISNLLYRCTSKTIELDFRWIEMDFHVNFRYRTDTKIFKHRAISFSLIRISPWIVQAPTYDKNIFMIIFPHAMNPHIMRAPRLLQPIKILLAYSSLPNKE